MTQTDDKRSPVNVALGAVIIVGIVMSGPTFYWAGWKLGLLPVVAVLASLRLYLIRRLR